MIRFTSTLVALLAVFLTAGCAGAPSKSNAEFMRDIALSNNKVVEKQIELRIEEERTKRAEAVRDNNMAVAISNIAFGGDITAKVNGQTSILAMAAARGGGSHAGNAPMPQLPPQPNLPPERDALDRFLQIASVVAPGGVPAVLAPVLGYKQASKALEEQTRQAKINADRDAHQWTVLGGMFDSSANSNTRIALGGFQSITDVSQYLGRPNVYQVGGDFAGGNLIGRYSGRNSGNSGQLNDGGLFNTGAGARFGSPGPYIQPICTGGDSSTGGGAPANSGDVNCPIQ